MGVGVGALAPPLPNSRGPIDFYAPKRYIFKMFDNGNKKFSGGNKMFGEHNKFGDNSNMVVLVDLTSQLKYLSRKEEIHHLKGKGTSHLVVREVMRQFN